MKQHFLNQKLGKRNNRRTQLQKGKTIVKKVSDPSRSRNKT